MGGHGDASRGGAGERRPTVRVAEGSGSRGEISDGEKRRARAKTHAARSRVRSAREGAASRVRYQVYFFGPEARWFAREGRRGRVGDRDVPRASGPSARQPYVARRPSRSSPRRSHRDARARARRARQPPARTDSAPHIFEVWRWTRWSPRRLETRAASPRTPRSTTSRASNTQGRVGEVERRTRAPRLCSDRQ